jgi:hypothetical protein
MLCFGCNKPGHKRENCPEQSNNPMLCFGCGKPGHKRENCPEQSNNPMLCFGCGKPGHRRDNCDVLRTANTTTTTSTSNAARWAEHSASGPTSSPTSEPLASGATLPVTLPASLPVCFGCGKPGHKREQCPLPLSEQNKSIKRPYQGEVNRIITNESADIIDTNKKTKLNDLEYNIRIIFGEKWGRNSVKIISSKLEQFKMLLIAKCLNLGIISPGVLDTRNNVTHINYLGSEEYYNYLNGQEITLSRSRIYISDYVVKIPIVMPDGTDLHISLLYFEDIKRNKDIIYDLIDENIKTINTEHRSNISNNENKEHKEEKEEPQNDCIICCSEKSTHILLQCGHFCLCGTCANIIEICPICRAPVEKTIRVYKL